MKVHLKKKQLLTKYRIIAISFCNEGTQLVSLFTPVAKGNSILYKKRLQIEMLENIPGQIDT